MRTLTATTARVKAVLGKRSGLSEDRTMREGVMKMKNMKPLRADLSEMAIARSSRNLAP